MFLSYDTVRMGGAESASTGGQGSTDPVKDLATRYNGEFQW